MGGEALRDLLRRPPAGTTFEQVETTAVPYCLTGNGAPGGARVEITAAPHLLVAGRVSKIRYLNTPEDWLCCNSHGARRMVSFRARPKRDQEGCCPRAFSNRAWSSADLSAFMLRAGLSGSLRGRRSERRMFAFRVG